MECEIENQQSKSAMPMVEDTDAVDSAKQDRDLDDIDVEAILSRSRGRQHKQNFYEGR